MAPKVEQWTDKVAQDVRGRLTQRELRLLPRRIDVHQQTDALGEEAWRLVLVLPKPQGETWKRDEVFKARRAAIEIFDQLAAEEGHTLPGSTIASVTTDQAAEDDVAPEDEPEEGEDPGRES